MRPETPCYSSKFRSSEHSEGSRENLAPNEFSNNFMRKTTIVRNKIVSYTPNNTGDISMDADIMFNVNIREMFRPTSEVEVKDIIIKSHNKSYNLDSLPTWPLKKYMDQFLPLITDIVNRSMDKSVMPLCLKRASITSLLKRSGELSSYF